MRFILIVSLIALTTNLLELHKYLAGFSDQLQNICANHVPNNSQQDLQKALVCGINLPTSSPWKNLLVQTGLIHVIVVSGTHFITLLILVNFLCKGSLRSLASLVVLSSYAMMTGLQAPAIRSLLTLGFSTMLFRMKIPHNALQILMMSVILCFGFNAEWVESLSLILSAYAGLALCWRTSEQSTVRLFEQQTHFYLLLMPVLAGFQNLNPIQFLANICFAPFLSLVLFPIAMFGITFSRLNFVFEKLANGSFFTLQQLQLLIPEGSDVHNRQSFYGLWAIWLCIWIYMDIRDRHRMRLSWHY
jgi:ComEC/Rec2-related protein